MSEFRILVKNFLSKLFFIILIVIFLYCKPFFSFSLLFFFMAEHILFFNMILNIWNNKNDYYKIYPMMKPVSTSGKNSLEIWYWHCWLSAYRRLYVLLLRNKKTPFSFIILFFILIFEIPTRFLKYFYYFVFKNNNGFRKGLLILYNKQYLDLENTMIEIYSGEIYLNCYTIGEFFNKLQLYKLPKDKAGLYLIQLSQISKQFNLHEKQFKEVEFQMSRLITNEGITKLYHPTYLDKCGTAIHSTSKKPEISWFFQKFDTPLRTLTKPNAVNPVTVITPNSITYNNLKIKNYFSAPLAEINLIKYNNPDYFELGKIEYNYTHEKILIFREILLKNNLIKDDVFNDFEKELQLGYFNHILCELTDHQLLKVLDDYFYESNL